MHIIEGRVLLGQGPGEAEGSLLPLWPHEMVRMEPCPHAPHARKRGAAESVGCAALSVGQAPGTTFARLPCSFGGSGRKGKVALAPLSPSLCALPFSEAWWDQGLGPSCDWGLKVAPLVDFAVLLCQALFQTCWDLIFAARL